MSNTDVAHIQNSTFTYNRADTGGGIKTDRQLTVTNCKFTANYANYTGGAIHSHSQIIISYSSFTNNTAQNGGAVFATNYFEISNCIFTNSYIPPKADDWNDKWTGKAISIISDKPLLKTSLIRNTIFINNYGTETIRIFSSKVEVANISFINNGIIPLGEQPISRGCLYLLDSTVEITGPVTLTGNVGGGIHAIQSQILINSTGDTVISNNTASSGGGIMLRESKLIIRSSVNISGNKAVFGGGVYAHQSEIDFISEKPITERFISNNFASQNGGGVYLLASTIKLTFLYFYVLLFMETVDLSSGASVASDPVQIVFCMKHNSQWWWPLSKREFKNIYL